MQGRTRRGRGSGWRGGTRSGPLESLDEAQQQLAESHEELRQWTEHLEEEVARKTQQLEERNRHLSIVNATSFALREAMEDAPALERALRLIARLLEAKAVQTLLCEEGPAIENLRLVATNTEALPPPALPEPMLSEVAESGEPVFSDDEGVDQSTALRGLGGFAAVPLTANGRSLGALAVVGRAPLEWSESERRLLLLIGRDVSAALEHLRMYRAALDRAPEEALLNEVMRTLNGEGEVARAVTSALALVAERIGAVTLSVVSRTEQSREQTVVAQAPTLNAASDGSGAGPALSRGRRATLLAAPGLVSDRATPLILGAGGEAPRSDGEPGTLVIAPLRAGPDGCGALVASAREDATWGEREAELLGRLAEMIAQRLQSAELLRLQRRRIAELAGLAKVAETVQSTVDLERLFAGFARAMHEMLPLRALHIGRLDDDGVPVGTTTVRQRGKDVTHGPADLLDPGHPWFALKGTSSWSRGGVAPGGFIADDEDHAVLASLRAKGRVLGWLRWCSRRRQRPTRSSSWSKRSATCRSRSTASRCTSRRRSGRRGSRCWEPRADRGLGGGSERGVRCVREGSALADPVRSCADAAGESQSWDRAAVGDVSALGRGCGRTGARGVRRRAGAEC